MTEEKLTHFFETMNAQTSIEHFREIYDDTVQFKDPFNVVEGILPVYEIFTHMYQNLDNPRFVVNEYVNKKHIAYVKWEFIFAFKGVKKENSFEGVSRLQMNNEGKVVSHVDFWDAAEHMYEKMPLIGMFLRFIKRKIGRS